LSCHVLLICSPGHYRLMGHSMVVLQNCQASGEEPMERGSRVEAQTFGPRAFHEQAETEMAEQTTQQDCFWTEEYRARCWLFEELSNRAAARLENDRSLSFRFAPRRFGTLAPWRIGFRKKKPQEAEAARPSNYSILSLASIDRQPGGTDFYEKSRGRNSR
jgi:hypothetical protein